MHTNHTSMNLMMDCMSSIFSNIFLKKRTKEDAALAYNS